MRALLPAIAAMSLYGQIIINPDKVPEQLRAFPKPSGESRLECSVTPVPARLNLAFRFQAGYGIQVPARQFSGPAHQLHTILRITPDEEERGPVWLGNSYRLPPIPEGTKKAAAEIGGGFVVGEGNYRVDLLVVDDQNRWCLADWNVKARLKGATRQVEPGLPPGTVDDVSLRRWRRQPMTVSGGQNRLSVLMHVASTVPGRVRLRGYDRMLLMSALGSLLERIPAQSVRLTIFSMDRQTELFHTEDLDSRSFRKGMEALNQLELGTVDYSTLQNRTGHVDLVADLLGRELEAKPDAVVVIGPLARWTDNVPAEAIPEPEGNTPVWYVQLRPWIMFRGVQPDTISRAVKKVGGRVKEVYSPEDFAEAIRDLTAALNRPERVARTRTLP